MKDCGLYIDDLHQQWRFPDLCISRPHTGPDELDLRTLGYHLTSWRNGEARFPLRWTVDGGEHILDRTMNDRLVSFSGVKFPDTHTGSSARFSLLRSSGFEQAHRYSKVLLG